MPIFEQNYVKSVKTLGARAIFFKIFNEKTPSFIHMVGQKNVNSVKTTLFYGPKKSIGSPYFPTFHEKKYCSHAHILSKNVHSLKNTVLSCIFFQIFHEKPLLSCTYLVKITSILLKLHYIMGQKSL